MTSWPRALGLTFLIASFSSLGHSDERRDYHFMHLGARASGMGGAFTAFADDTTASYWNPAGIAFSPFLRVGAYTGREEMDRGRLLEGPNATALPESGRVFVDRASGLSVDFAVLGVAATWFDQSQSRQDGDSLFHDGLSTFDLSLSILQSLPVDNLVVAANLHYLRGTTFESQEPIAGLDSAAREPSAILRRATLGQGVTSNQFSLDVGVLYEANAWLRLGLMARQLTEPSFATASGGERVLPRHARVGAGLALAPFSRVAIDVDVTDQGPAVDEYRELSIGGEQGFFAGRLAVRAGARFEMGAARGSRPAFSAGVGASLWRLLIEASYSTSSGHRDRSIWLNVTVN